MCAERDWGSTGRWRGGGTDRQGWSEERGRRGCEGVLRRQKNEIKANPTKASKKLSDKLGAAGPGLARPLAMKNGHK